ncbi:phosphopantothenoylcysteine decarboxylase/phosphopantothenate--cysteine ligase [Rhizomicrobium palustre]|uniref:Coenzyme A biosynthesis bifunctional protein CoaBC n=1 Tax=Rhizomicrobium palustre TaxID=189966 RepID=A0A846N5A2_9PROT|nr:bifunctional phosphopantothenoylcysteine decarboxylase/phosphopantothenate--cysteine ligase CoaBC [Rhizomicrobium palustre]NIK90371.1 phosphopantothenoylcysteine decarboxylase/phosphopantothenate--cysteine ligase [Rhizomicrobium palustre]
MSKSILLIIGGGIAAYKSLDLIRRAKEREISTTAIITKAGTEFVTPLSVAALSGNKVYTDQFSLMDETEMGHIQLSRAADLIVVAPATANLMARAANGLASDLASTALLATDKPVLMAPAMNVRMWQHPATQRNLAQLQADGVHFVGPNEGAMACNEFGPGRMAEPHEILAAIERILSGTGPLTGVKALVTAGPTHEPIDPVRFIANRSSGKQGYAIAKALATAGAKTTLVSGPVDLAPPPGVKLVRVETAADMLAACEAQLPVDVAVMTAAVGDWRPESRATSKLKKTGSGAPSLTLAENPDILATLGKHARRPRLLIGFAAETENVVAYGSDKRTRKAADWILANDVSKGVFGADTNRVHLISEAGVESWPELSKDAVATRLADHIVKALEKAV